MLSQWYLILIEQYRCNVINSQCNSTMFIFKLSVQTRRFNEFDSRRRRGFPFATFSCCTIASRVSEIRSSNYILIFGVIAFNQGLKSVAMRSHFICSRRVFPVVQLFSRAIATGNFYNLYPAKLWSTCLSMMLRESRKTTGSIAPALPAPGLRKTDGVADDLFSSLCSIAKEIK